MNEPFTHDIFVSYAHADPMRTGKSKLKHWSERLAEELIADIHAIEIEFDPLEVFIDRDLDPTVELTPAIREEVSRAGLLLLIMSPHYLRSAWCSDELAWFESEVRRRAKSKGCILVVRAVPTQEKEWPACLKDVRGHTVLGFWFTRVQ